MAPAAVGGLGRKKPGMPQCRGKPGWPRPSRPNSPGWHAAWYPFRDRGEECMQFHAAGTEGERVVPPRAPLSQAGRWQALLLSESRALLAGPPPLFQALSPRERELVLSHGRRRVLNRGQTLFSQG